MRGSAEEAGWGLWRPSEGPASSLLATDLCWLSAWGEGLLIVCHGKSVEMLRECDQRVSKSQSRCRGREAKHAGRYQPSSPMSVQCVWGWLSQAARETRGLLVSALHRHLSLCYSRSIRKIRGCRFYSFHVLCLEMERDFVCVSLIRLNWITVTLQRECPV